MKIATPDDFVRLKVTPAQRAVVASLRKLMKKHAPNAIEGISHGMLAWKRNRIMAVLNPTKHDLTFSFSRGADFTDRHGLLQGVGKISKHVTINRTADINVAALRDYIEQAVEFDNT